MVTIAGIFGIHNHTASLIVDLAVVVLGVIWLALIYWTFADARRRIADSLLVGCATVAAFFPFIGTIIYMIVRPPEYLEDVHERDLEIQAAEARLAQIGLHTCPYCDYEVERSSCAAPTACASSGTRARTAASRSSPTGGSAPTARPTAASTRRSAAARVARGATQSRRWPRHRRQTCARSSPLACAGIRRLTNRNRTRRTRPWRAHADPRQARRLCPQPDRRDHRPVRAQGPDARRAEAGDAEP